MKHHIQLQTNIGSLALDVKAEFNDEIIIISGENGAGKTTLLRCLAGLEKATGRIHLNAAIWLDSPASFILPIEARNIGYLWSEEVLLPWLSVEKNIKLGINTHDQAWFESVAQSLEITGLIKRRPAMLSTGEAQRVSLARAIYRKPTLLLLDEPFSAQAPDIRLRLRKALQELQQQLNIPVILVSHDMQDAKVLADQHWRMREGKLLISTSLTNISQAQQEREQA